MIRYATPADIPPIESLWQTCFGDSKAYIEAFMASIGKPECCLVYETSGEIVSMMFLLPAQIFAKGELRPIYYIYACATLPEYRKQGIMNQLFEFAKSEAVKSSIFALVLIPSSEYLFAFYQKIGFQLLFKQPSFHTIKQESEHSIALSEEAIRQVISLRQQALKDELSIVWSSEYLSFALQDCAKAGSTVVFDGDKYCVFSNADKYAVKEAIPLNTHREESSKDYAVIYFCEPYQIPTDASPYFNFGLD